MNANIGQLNTHIQMNKVEPPTSHHNQKVTWNRSKTEKQELKQFLEENTVVNLRDFGLGNNCLDE